MIKMRTGDEATGVTVSWVIPGLPPRAGVDVALAWLSIHGVDVEATIGGGSMSGDDVVVMVALASPMEALVLDERDVLAVNGTVDLIRSGLPWRTETGVRGRFLLYIRPLAGPLKVNLGGYVFEINREGGVKN